MKKIKSIVLKFFILIILIHTHTIYAAKGGNSFIIGSIDNCSQIICNNKESKIVHTAIEIFSNDVYSICGIKPEILTKGNSTYQIKIGTLGVDKDFDKACVKDGINVGKLNGKWEAYNIKVISGSRQQTLLVVGSNPRGTAYGVMELSRLIGVSPWCWWADVKSEKKETVTLPENLIIEDAPKVKFRGIFLNDEDWGLKPWAAKTFEPETGDIGPKTYEKIFELLLRLKANAIWPAMHPCTRAFFTYLDNIKMADKYGVWVGSSHCEPMLRNNVDEWYRWNPSEGKRGEWNYDENPEQVTEYWSQRVKTTANYDGIYTVGMRGIHDGSMPGGKDINDKVEILDRVLDTQRNLLNEITGKEVTSIPQIFCPYKEVLQLYKAGAEIPDDVTIMWADDNNGYIRQLSNEEERKRAGGAGVYYHISYWGRPHDFLWLESIPVSLIWEEMNKAYQTNARNIWIVNVGDIKPNEIGMNFFLDMAWDPDQFTPENLNSYYETFAKEQFGEPYSKEIGSILQQYFQLGFSRKPEHMGWTTVYPDTKIADPEFSLYTNGDEVQKRIDAYDEIENKVKELLKNIPENKKDAFYQLVAYKVIGASNMNKKLLYAYKSREYAKQSRQSSNLYASLSEKAFDKIKKETIYYNDSLADGKWKHMMSYNPRELPVFDMPITGTYNAVENNFGGIMPEGYSSDFMQTLNYTLPVFNSFTNRKYFVDIFNSGTSSLKWEVKTLDKWVNVSKIAGQTNVDERVWISVDWDKVSSNDTISSKVQFILNGQEYPVTIKAIKPEWNFSNKNVFVEDNCIVCIEAEHYTNQKKTEHGEWNVIQSLGRESDAMGTFPVTAVPFETNDLSKSPSLSYNFYSLSKGNAYLKFYCIPNQPINDDYQLRFTVSIDESDPVIVNATLQTEMDEHNPEWQKNVLRSVIIPEIITQISKKGEHTLEIKMIDPGVVLDKITIDFGGLSPSYFGANETIISN